MTSFTHLPLFKDIIPAQIEPTITDLLNKNRRTLEQLLSQPGPFTWDNLMQPLEDMHDQLNNTWAPISHLHAVMESEDLRNAYNQVLPHLTDYHTELTQNEKLFNAVLSIKNSDAFNQLNQAQRKIIENDLRDFKLAGVHLPQDKKKRLAALHTQLSKLTTLFSENLLDATGAFIIHIEDVAELKGLPPQALQLAIDNAKRRHLSGYVLTLDYPSYSTAIKFLENQALRKKIYEAYVTRASDRGPNAHKWDNSSVMEDILKVRQEIAKLVGFHHYSAYSLATKMAKKPEEVTVFLRDLATKSKPLAEKEYQDILDFAKKIEQLSLVNAWDLYYYSEKLRESQFHFSQEDLRPYFPIDKVLDGLFSIVHTLYGIRIQKEENIDVWHPDVAFFSVFDEQGPRGGLYMDFYARPHKRDGAWMDECRVRRSKQDQTIQYPIAFLTCNFMPPVGDLPALLTHDDVVTLFHEFGHCLHHILTKINYASVAGINGVPWDAVEFPSQFMENYCWEQKSLSLIAAHFQTGEPLPDDLFEKMLAAKHFETGLQMLRQIEFALFDFELHLAYDPHQANQIQSTLDRIRQEVAVIHVPEFNRFQHSFSHIFAGGYAAGYYSYKWAEVLSADAYAAFEEKGIFDSTTGRSFLQNILEMGGARDPMDSFIAFRGRKPNIDALLRHNGITTQS